MDVSVKWHDGMRFTAYTPSGFELTLDADESVGGSNQGPRPLELMALSLAGCTAMDVISILKKKRQDVTDFEVKVHAGRAEDHPKVFTDLHIEYLVYGRNIDPKAVERAIELSETRYCPAQAMLSQVAPTTLDYKIIPVA